MHPRHNLPPDDRPEIVPTSEPKSTPAASDEILSSSQSQASQLAPEQRPVSLTPAEASRQRDNPDSPFIAVELQSGGDGSRAKPYRQFEVGITLEHQRARLHDIQLKIGLAEVELDQLSDQVEQQRSRVEAINQDWRAVRAELAQLSGPERAELLAEFHRFRRQQQAASRLLEDRSVEFNQLAEQLDQLYQTRDRYQSHDGEAAA